MCLFEKLNQEGTSILMITHDSKSCVESRSTCFDTGWNSESGGKQMKKSRQKAVFLIAILAISGFCQHVMKMLQ